MLPIHIIKSYSYELYKAANTFYKMLLVRIILSCQYTIYWAAPTFYLEPRFTLYKPACINFTGLPQQLYTAINTYCTKLPIYFMWKWLYVLYWAAYTFCTDLLLRIVQDYQNITGLILFIIPCSQYIVDRTVCILYTELLIYRKQNSWIQAANTFHTTLLVFIVQSCFQCILMYFCVQSISIHLPLVAMILKTHLL